MYKRTVRYKLAFGFIARKWGRDRWSLRIFHLDFALSKFSLSAPEDFFILAPSPPHSVLVEGFAPKVQSCPSVLYKRRLSLSFSSSTQRRASNFRPTCYHQPASHTRSVRQHLCTKTKYSIGPNRK